MLICAGCNISLLGELNSASLLGRGRGGRTQMKIEKMGGWKRGHKLAQRKHLSRSLPHEGERQSFDSDREQQKQDIFDQQKTAFLPRNTSGETTAPQPTAGVTFRLRSAGIVSSQPVQPVAVVGGEAPHFWIKRPDLDKTNLEETWHDVTSTHLQPPANRIGAALPSHGYQWK